MNELHWPPSLRMALFGTTAVASLLTPLEAAAQSGSVGATGLWAAAAVGVTPPYDIGILGTAAFRYRRVIVRARYASAGEVAGYWFEDLGMLVDVVATPPSRRAQLAVGAGIGRARCRHCTTLVTQPKPPPSAGFLVDAEGRLAVTRFLGASAYLFADFNSTQSFGGIAVGCYLGGL